jgi:hypothetical protein
MTEEEANARNLKNIANALDDVARQLERLNSKLSAVMVRLDTGREAIRIYRSNG